jgi:hypothetical protein
MKGYSEYKGRLWRVDFDPVTKEFFQSFVGQVPARSDPPGSLPEQMLVCITHLGDDGSLMMPHPSTP